MKRPMVLISVSYITFDLSGER